MLVPGRASGFLEGKVYPGLGLSPWLVNGSTTELEHQVGVAGEGGKDQSEFLCSELISDVLPCSPPARNSWDRMRP